MCYRVSVSCGYTHFSTAITYRACDPFWNTVLGTSLGRSFAPTNPFYLLFVWAKQTGSNNAAKQSNAADAAQRKGGSKARRAISAT
jgi:hypothetical protein